MNIENFDYKTILELASDGIYLLDTEGILIEYNKKAKTLLGFRSDEMDQLSVFDWDKELTKDEWIQMVQRAQNHPLELERTHTRKDGTQYIAHITAVQLLLDEKKLIYTSIRDITTLKKDQDEVIKAQAKFASLFNYALDPILLLDIETRKFVDVNPQASYVYGYTKDEFLNLGAEALDSVYDEIHIKRVQNNIVSQGWDRFETQHRLKDGSIIDVFVSAAAINLFDKDYLYVTIRDITAQKRQEERIYHQKKEFETIFYAAKDPIAILDLESNFLDFNAAYHEMLGYTREELLRTSCIAMSIPEDIPKAKKAVEEILQVGYVKNWEKSCYKKDGSILTINMTMTLMPDRERIVIVSKDITELKEKERLLFEQSKMASMGEMIGNIAHQWRQPLAVISSSTASIKLDSALGLFDEHRLHKSLQVIEDNILYLTDTIDTFRNFLKEEKAYKKVVLQESIKNTLHIVSTTLKNHHITLKDNIDYDNPLKIDLYESELSQVIINIVNNAKYVLIERDIKEPWVRITAAKKHDHAHITIEDNGGGIPNDIKSKIFEPYFTTKHQSIGTGLGLHMSYKIIHESLKGKLYAQNTKNGAKFTIELPLTQMLAFKASQEALETL